MNGATPDGPIISMARRAPPRAAPSRKGPQSRINALAFETRSVRKNCNPTDTTMSSTTNGVVCSAVRLRAVSPWAYSPAVTMSGERKKIPDSAKMLNVMNQPAILGPFAICVG